MNCVNEPFEIWDLWSLEVGINLVLQRLSFTSSLVGRRCRSVNPRVRPNRSMHFHYLVADDGLRTVKVAITALGTQLSILL